MDTISSPLRKLEWLGPEPEKDGGHGLSLHSFGRLDTILHLSPQEILELQQDQFDYICGVESLGHPCKNSLYCSVHSLEERMEIQRSLPLPALIRHEIHDQSLFRKKRRLIKLYHDCKAYWHSNQSVLETPGTCSRTSCVNELAQESNSTQRGSQTSNLTCGDDGNQKQKKFSSLKKAFLKKISKPTDSNVSDRMSYLLYKLSSIETQELTARARELEVRFSTSD